MKATNKKPSPELAARNEGGSESVTPTILLSQSVFNLRSAEKLLYCGTRGERRWL
jgi:hypothetical protein